MMTDHPKYTWLITGASSGLGAHIAIEALKAGNGVVGTARNVSKAREDYPEIEQLGGSWITLDVTSPDTEKIVEKAVREKGVNVLVNNAGYGLRGVLEDLSLEEVRRQMETNFFGAVAATKGAIPTFREQRFGSIVNISSTAGMMATPGNGLYSASKFALEGLSEALSQELKPFNIRVLIVQPGGFRTNFQAAVLPGEGRRDGEWVSEPYRNGPAEQTAQNLRGGHGKQPGDPVKAGQAIVQVVTGEGLGSGKLGLLRLPLGKDAVQRTYAKVKNFSEDVESAKNISEWAVFDE